MAFSVRRCILCFIFKVLWLSRHDGKAGLGSRVKLGNALAQVDVKSRVCPKSAIECTTVGFLSPSSTTRPEGWNSHHAPSKPRPCTHPPHMDGHVTSLPHPAIPATVHHSQPKYQTATTLISPSSLFLPLPFSPMPDLSAAACTMMASRVVCCGPKA